MSSGCLIAPYAWAKVLPSPLTLSFGGIAKSKKAVALLSLRCFSSFQSNSGFQSLLSSSCYINQLANSTTWSQADFTLSKSCSCELPDKLTAGVDGDYELPLLDTMSKCSEQKDRQHTF